MAAGVAGGTERLPDWADDVPDVVARWRGSVTVHGGGNARLHELIAELTRRSPEFDRWWNTYDVQEHRSRMRRFQHPEHGDVTMRLVIVKAPEFGPCIVVFHLPADGLH